MSEERIVLVVAVAAAASPEWFVEIVHDGRVKKLRGKLGEPITVPAGAWVSRYGPVDLPDATLTFGSISPPR